MSSKHRCLFLLPSAGYQAPPAYTSPQTHKVNRHETAKMSLVCHEVLSPPVRTIGHGEEILRFHGREPAWQVAFSRDGRYLAVCYGAIEPCVRIWKQQSPFHEDSGWILDATLTGIQTRTIRSIAFAPIRTPLILASASFDGTVAVWEHYPATNGALVTASAKSPSGVDEWECTAQLEGHESEVKCVQWNATGSLLASCGRDKTVWIWECFLPGAIGGPSAAHPSPSGHNSGGGDFECIAVLHGHEGDVKCVRFTSSHDEWGDGDEILLSSSYDNTIKCWAEDAGDWYCAASIEDVHSSTIWSLAMSPSGLRMISGSDDQSLGIYKCYTASEKKRHFPDEGKNRNGLWKCVGHLPDAHSASIFSVAYAPSRAGHGRIATAGADNRIQIFREVSGSVSDQPLFTVETSATNELGDVNCVSWHPSDGSILATAGDDGSVCIWKFNL
jgi:WD40 repeat protein